MQVSYSIYALCHIAYSICRCHKGLMGQSKVSYVFSGNPVLLLESHMGHSQFYSTFSLLYPQHGTGCHACGWYAVHANSLHLLKNIYLFGCVRSQRHVGSLLWYAGHMQALHCSQQASLVEVHILQLWCVGSQHKGSAVCELSCPIAHGILVPQPWIKPLYPASEGGFLTTEPSGKPLSSSPFG